MPEGNPVPVWDWSRRAIGVADRFDPSRLEMDEWSLAQNAYEDGGSMKKRGGTVRVGGTLGTAPVRKIFHAYHTTSGVRRSLGLCGTNMKYWNGSAWGTPTTAASLTAGRYPSMFQHGNIVYGCDGQWARQWTIAATVVETAWAPFGAEVPKLACLFFNRAYFTIESSPHEVFWTELGLMSTTGASSAYSVPDDQSQPAPIALLACSQFVGLFGPDYVVRLTGAGPTEHRLVTLPKGAKLLSSRAVVSMGDYFVLLTTEGLMLWDGSEQGVQPVDPRGKVNWHDITTATPELTHLQKHGRRVLICFPSGGDVGIPDTAAISVTWTDSLGRSGSWIVAAARGARPTVLARGGTRTAIKAGSATITNKYYVYDSQKNKIMGPNDGNFLSGCEEDPILGDRGDMWMGDSTTAGRVWKIDQAIFLDDDDGTGTVGTKYEFRLRSGCFGLNPMRTYELTKIRLRHNIVERGPAMATLEGYWDLEKEPSWTRTINYLNTGPYGGDEGDQTDSTKTREHADTWGSGEMGVTKEDGTQEQVVGRVPQVGVVEISDNYFEVLGLEPWYVERERGRM
jgi:hypothetical protein